MQRGLILVGFSYQLHSYVSSLLKSCEVLRIERESPMFSSFKKKPFILKSSCPLNRSGCFGKEIYSQYGNVSSVFLRIQVRLSETFRCIYPSFYFLSTPLSKIPWHQNQFTILPILSQTSSDKVRKGIIWGMLESVDEVVHSQGLAALIRLLESPEAR